MAIFLVPFVIKQLGKVSSVSRIPGKDAEHLECDFAGLIARFDRRAAALRGQANIYLGLIICILAGGAVAFAFAAEISRFDLRAPPSLQEQLDRAEGALESNVAEAQKVNAQIAKATNTTFIDVNSPKMGLRRSQALSPLAAV